MESAQGTGRFLILAAGAVMGGVMAMETGPAAPWLWGMGFFLVLGGLALVVKKREPGTADTRARLLEARRVLVLRADELQRTMDGD
jgi:Flp pilus assembly protein TadG